MKNLIFTAVIVCIVFSAIICPLLPAAEQKAPPTAPAGPPPAPTPATPPTPPPAAKPVNPNELVVTVNGIEITEGQVDMMSSRQLRRMVPQGGQLPPGMLDQLKGQFRPQAIDGLIVEQLVEQQVTDANVVVTEQDVLNHIKEMGRRQKPPMTLEKIQEMFAGQGRSFDAFKDQLMQSKDLKFKKHIDTLFADKIKVTDEDIKKYYDENKQKYEHPDLARARHILIMPEKMMPDKAATDPNAAKDAAKAKAEELLKQLKENKADFAELARTNSHCTSAPSGGALPFFPREGMMVPEFSNAAFALEVGQITDIVETQFGYHIIRLDEMNKAGTYSLEEVTLDIKDALSQEQRNKLTAEYFESLKAKATIVYAPGKEPKPVPAPTPATAPPPQE